MKGRLVAVCASDEKGRRKMPRGSGVLREEHGLVGDAHAEGGSRQLSLLALESIRKMQALGLRVGPGDFAENLTTEGLPLSSLPVGARLAVGEALLEVTRIGKECHARCAIFHLAGDCVMPREGIFARVVRGGTVRDGDRVSVVETT